MKVPIPFVATTRARKTAPKESGTVLRPISYYVGVCLEHKPGTPVIGFIVTRFGPVFHKQDKNCPPAEAGLSRVGPPVTAGFACVQAGGFRMCGNDALALHAHVGVRRMQGGVRFFFRAVAAFRVFLPFLYIE